MARIKLETQGKARGEKVVINFRNEDYVALKLNNGVTKPVHKHLATYLVTNGKGEIVKGIKLTKDEKGIAQILDVD